MKKRLITTILLLIVPMLGLFAATDIDLALSAKTGMDINLSKPTDRSFSTKIDAELESIIGVYFDGKKSGLDMLFGTDFKQSFILGAGYAYRTNLEASSDFILAAGPYFKFGNDFNVGFYARADLRGLEQSFHCQAAQQPGADLAQLLVQLQENPALLALLNGLLKVNVSA